MYYTQGSKHFQPELLVCVQRCLRRRHRFQCSVDVRNVVVSGKSASRVEMSEAALRSCRQRMAAIRSAWRLALGQQLVGSGPKKTPPAFRLAALVTN